MARVLLSGGAYVARSLIAGAQRQVNLYSEINKEESPTKHTLYPTPGLSLLSTPPVGAGRGLFRASNNQLFAAVGSVLYAVSSSWVFTSLGSISSGMTTPVRMADNGVDMLVIDGTSNGYTVSLATNTFGTLSSSAFYGSDCIGFLDTFFVLNKPGTGIFYSSLGLSTTFDPLYFAAKIGYADRLIAIAVLHREVWLIGNDTSEVWVNSGGVAFPFSIMTGAFIEHGCIAKYSLTKLGDALFWLSQNKEGKAVVLQGAGYQAKAISTAAVVNAMASYAVISDAVGMALQFNGHQMYVLTFPTADVTWVYDVSSAEWFEWLYSDTDGTEHRHRAGAMAYAYGVNLALDWSTGALYQLSLDSYTDTGTPIVRRRGFPHMMQDGKRVQYLQFIADMEVGAAANTADGAPAGVFVADPPTLFLRWSDDRGASWSNPISTSFGTSGDYLESLQFQRLGMARDRVFELFWSAPIKTALNGAFIVTRSQAS